MPRKNGGTNEPQVEPNRRGAARVERTESRRYHSDTASYAGCDNQLLRDALVAITDSGAAVLFGRTSDGGALTIQVYDGQERIREYPHTAEEAEGVLSWLRDMFSAD